MQEEILLLVLDVSMFFLLGPAMMKHHMKVFLVLLLTHKIIGALQRLPFQPGVQGPPYPLRGLTISCLIAFSPTISTGLCPGTIDRE